MNTGGIGILVLALFLIFASLINPNIFFTNTAAFFQRSDTLPDVSTPDTSQEENLLFQSVEHLEESQIYRLIDSLLNEEIIPLELIHEIRLYVKSHYSKEGDTGDVRAGMEMYPASNIYLGWDTYNTHPYPEKLFRSDSMVELILQDGFRRFVIPVDGKITSLFGDRRNHNGVDIDLEVWDPVVSAFDGMVRIARRHGGYGRVIVVRHYNGLETLYAHLHRIKVNPGDLVKSGDIIGLGGSSGRSTGSHLHFECRFKGKPLNLGHFIDFKRRVLISDTIMLKKNSWSYTVIPKGIVIHVVQEGEFLYKIAQRYGTTVKQLCELNGISRNSILRIGQKLRIG